MIKIDKSVEPSALTTHRLNASQQFTPSYHNMPTEVKTLVRQQLLSEQGYLCAYCMQRIKADNSKIEHWHSQTHYPSEQLHYQNLLGVCQGNEGQTFAQQTCDTRKADQALLYNPADQQKDIAQSLYYAHDGKLYAHEAAFDVQLNQVLNLNQVRLVKNRKAVLTALHQQLNKQLGTRSRAELEKLYQKWQHADQHGKKMPFCGIALYYLEKRLHST